MVRALGGDRLLLRKVCMEGTRQTILRKIEDAVNKVDGHNVIWIRGSPGVGKSALAASISTRLQDQGRRIIPFRFDRTHSTRITTEALWRVVACDLAHWYPSLRQHLAKGIEGYISSDIDRLFKLLIETPLSTLDYDIPHEQLPVIVIDALDECGGLRHDDSGQKDHDVLLRTLRHWAVVDHLQKFKLVITSRPEENVTRMFPDSISTHVNIPSGSDVRLGDSVSDDIHAFLKLCLKGMGMEDAWIEKALDYLVPRAAGIFIWATTVANFLRMDPRGRFDILQARNNTEGLDELYSLYCTVVGESFGGIIEEEVLGVTCVIGAMIFARQPLNNDALLILPGVKTRSSHIMRLIRKGLMSVIDSGPILRFHHRSFEDFLLSDSFRRYLPNLSGVQNRYLHEQQLAVLCLNTMVSSKLHFNMSDLKSSSIKNVDISATDKSAVSPLISYSSQFWADHLVQNQCEENLMNAVKFVMHEKLLFWIEAMSILGKAHEVSAILKRTLEWPGLAVCPEFVSYTTTLRLAC